MKRLSVVNVAAVVFSILSATGCQHDPSAGQYLRTSPVHSEIVGKYVPDAASRKRRIELPMSGAVLPIDPSASIILSENNTAEFVRVPFADWDGRKPCSISGKGSWSSGQSQGYEQVYVRIQNDEPGGLCERDFAYPLMLYGHKAPYKLHLIIEDPDLGEFVQFEKQH